MMLRPVLIAALLMPFGLAAKGETFADVAGLLLQHAETTCGGPLAAQAADTRPGTKSLATFLDELQASGAGQPWPGDWPPTDATVKAFSVAAYAATEWLGDMQEIDILRHPRGREVTREAQGAAARLAKSGALFACLTPTEAELASVPDSGGARLSWRDLKAMGCVARYAPRISEVVQVGRLSDEVRTDLSAIDAQLIACQEED
jgi:hypothetical protein